MSESPDERTKRVFIQHLDLADWSYQYSIFYYDKKDAQDFAIGDSQKLRKAIARKFNDRPFLYRLCLLYRKKRYESAETIDEKTGEAIETTEISETGYEETAYHMFFTTAKLSFKDLQLVVDKCCASQMIIRNRTRSEEQIVSYKSAVKNQRSHNLKNFFGNKKINRFSFLNAKALS
ncbi:MAG: hypothetical protein JWO53_1258 [Chlamydiia bacterium]|nr:hypothetical protein [Chlamydiia bacterium]